MLYQHVSLFKFSTLNWCRINRFGILIRPITLEHPRIIFCIIVIAIILHDIKSIFRTSRSIPAACYWVHNNNLIFFFFVVFCTIRHHFFISFIISLVQTELYFHDTSFEIFQFRKESINFSLFFFQIGMTVVSKHCSWFH